MSFNEDPVSFKIERENEENHQKWLKSFDDEKKRKLLICAEYYSHTKYNFNGLIKQILLNNFDDISEKHYNYIVNNKYAQKVIQATLSVPKFKKNDLVEVRNNVYEKGPRLLNKLAFVIQVNSSPVIRAMKGGKRYRIMPFGSSSTIEIEERFLKKVKNKL